MGIVYKAHDLRLGRVVALKMIRPEFRNARLEAAFKREARLASSLNHPGIITIFDIVTDNDPVYFVMEYVAGKPLSELIPERGFPAPKAIALAQAIGDALAAAHAANIVHRDLKPGNILVMESGHIKILDFGLAKLQQSDTDSKTQAPTLLGENNMVGTIAYMAPEQARGEAVDHRADIFSFGVILSQMFTGALPFPATSPVGLLRAIQLDAPAPIRGRRPELSEALENIVLRALEKDPASRFQSVAGMMELMGRLKDESVAPVSPSIASRGAFSSLPDSSARSSDAQPPASGSERSSIAVLPFRSLSQDPEDGYLAAGLASEIIRALTGVPRLRVAPQLASFRLGDQADPRMVGKALNTRYVVSGTLRRAGDRLRITAELIDTIQETVAWTQIYDRRMTDIFAVEEEISKAIVSSIGGYLIRADTDTAFRIPTESLDAWGLVRKAYHIWNYEFSPAGVAQSISLLQRAMQLDPEYATPFAYLGMYLMQMVLHGIAPDPVAASASALSAAERACALAPNDPEVLECCSLVWLQNSQYEKAVQCLKRAVQSTPFDLVAWGYLGLAHGTAGGEAEVREAHRILTRIIADAPDHPSVSYWLQFLTSVNLRMGQYEEAIANGRRCVEMQPAYTLQNVLLAEALCRTGQTGEARRVLEAMPRYNPNFTVPHFEKVVFAICRSPDILDQFCAHCRILQEAKS
jgi:serine/threonine protein kinase/tetratricopeptide (TPR) repeat protein